MKPQRYIEAVREVRPRGGFASEVAEVLDAIATHMAAGMPDGGSGFLVRSRDAVAGKQSASAEKKADKSPAARAAGSGKPAASDGRTESIETVVARMLAQALGQSPATEAPVTVEEVAATAPATGSKVKVTRKSKRCPQCGKGGGFGATHCQYDGKPLQ